MTATAIKFEPAEMASQKQYRDAGHNEGSGTTGERIYLAEIAETVGGEQKQLIAHMQRRPAQDVGQRRYLRQGGIEQRRHGKGHMAQHHTAHAQILVVGPFHQKVPGGVQQGGNSTTNITDGDMG